MEDKLRAMLVAKIALVFLHICFVFSHARRREKCTNKTLLKKSPSAKIAAPEKNSVPCCVAKKLFSYLQMGSCLSCWSTFQFHAEPSF